MTHILGEHTELVITTAKTCRPGTHTPDQARALLEAVLQCIDLAGGVTAATRPRAASPAKPVFANRTRGNTGQAAPMNPVQRHYGDGHSGRPPGATDSGYWRHEYQRVTSHFDRCEVVRRAAGFLASLLEVDPDAPRGELTEDHVRAQVLIEGQDWPLEDVARKFHQEQRTVVRWRIEAGRHPLTGKPWTPPDGNFRAAIEARAMKAAGLFSTDIGEALGKSANTIRAWTTNRRLAA